MSRRTIQRSLECENAIDCGNEPNHLLLASAAPKDLEDSNPTVQVHQHESIHWLKVWNILTLSSTDYLETSSKYYLPRTTAYNKSTRSVGKRRTCPNQLYIFWINVSSKDWHQRPNTEHVTSKLFTKLPNSTIEPKYQRSSHIFSQRPRFGTVEQ